jgi:endonuclease/exonuclease/phosphatase (EEP) superfamily protein YafD
MRLRRLSIVAAAVLGTNVLVVAPLYFAPSDAQPDSTATVALDKAHALEILLLNVMTANERKTQVACYVEGSGADLVFLIEVDEAWRQEMETGTPRYRSIAAAPRSDNFGMMVLAKTNSVSMSVVDARVIELLPDRTGLPAIETVVRGVDGGKTWILAAHPVPPTSPSRAAIRDAQLRAVGDRIRRADSAIVVGDLNATPWSAPFRRLVGDHDLVDSQRGHGAIGTWPATFPALARIPIDLVLHDGKLVTIDRAVGPPLGSDHLPVHVTIARRTD